MAIDDLRLERWQKDRDIFVKKAESLGANVFVQSANGNEETQMSQIENMINRGVDVLVIIPYNGQVLSNVVKEAKQEGIKVLAYDRMINNADIDYYISFDNEKVGELQAQSLIDKVPQGNYFLMGGSPVDNNAKLFREGQMKVLKPYIDNGKIKVVGDQWADGWLPENALKIMENALTANNNKIDAVVASNDATAGGALKLRTEGVIHPRDDDLDERQAYDVAIQVSDLGGHLHLSIQRDDATTPVDLDSLEEPIALITKALKDAAILWDFSQGPLEQAAFGDTLYALAANGSLLAQHLRQKCGDGIDDWERIQLVPTTNKFLPLEYVYDGPPPSPDATPCPNLLAALEHGSCCQPGAGARRWCATSLLKGWTPPMPKARPLRRASPSPT